MPEDDDDNCKCRPLLLTACSQACSNPAPSKPVSSSRQQSLSSSLPVGSVPFGGNPLQPHRTGRLVPYQDEQLHLLSPHQVVADAAHTSPCLAATHDLALLIGELETELIHALIGGDVHSSMLLGNTPNTQLMSCAELLESFKKQLPLLGGSGDGNLCFKRPSLTCQIFSHCEATFALACTLLLATRSPGPARSSHSRLQSIIL